MPSKLFCFNPARAGPGGVLELKGNAWPDLAGCLLTFANPHKRILHPGLDSLNPVQQGQVGDITASRKVRVFDVPVEEACLMCKRGENPPRAHGQLAAPRMVQPPKWARRH